MIRALTGHPDVLCIGNLHSVLHGGGLRNSRAWERYRNYEETGTTGFPENGFGVIIHPSIVDGARRLGYWPAGRDPRDMMSFIYAHPRAQLASRSKHPCERFRTEVVALLTWFSEVPCLFQAFGLGRYRQLIAC
jgi:hypothetical protein